MEIRGAYCKFYLKQLQLYHLGVGGELQWKYAILIILH